MDKIVRSDRRNKVALIEPGITFQELIDEADKMGLKVLMPLLPRAGKSVIGSYLEREPIQIPKYHWDMTDPLLCTELVFGTGDLFRTGSAAGPGSLEQQWDHSPHCLVRRLPLMVPPCEPHEVECGQSHRGLGLVEVPPLRI